MKLTMSSEIGIHAVWYLTARGGEQPVLSAEIARVIMVSETYLVKVLERLVRARILISRKGKRGGYHLKRKPEEISLADIVRACEGGEGGDDIYHCQHEVRNCRYSRDVCPVCIATSAATRALYSELSATTVADLMKACCAMHEP